MSYFFGSIFFKMIFRRLIKNKRTSIKLTKIGNHIYVVILGQIIIAYLTLSWLKYIDTRFYIVQHRTTLNLLLELLNRRNSMWSDPRYNLSIYTSYGRSCKKGKQGEDTIILKFFKYERVPGNVTAALRDDQCLASY